MYRNSIANARQMGHISRWLKPEDDVQNIPKHSVYIAVKETTITIHDEDRLDPVFLNSRLILFSS